jgi:ATP-dependent DNA helicase RecQ
VDTAPDQAIKVLADRFGFAGFKPGQAEVIGHLLAWRSAAAVFPTGGGKSLRCQVPALLLPGLTLVVSPLIA